MKHPSLTLDPLPQSGCAEGCSSGRGPGCVGRSVGVCPGFQYICLDFSTFVWKEPALAFLWVKGPGKCAPWREPSHLRPAGSQSRREPTRARQPSERTPTTAPKSAHTRASDPPRTTQNLRFAKPCRGSRRPRRKGWRPGLAPPPGTPRRRLPPAQ